MNFSIVEYQPEYRDWVRILNEEWLRKYFEVEPSDVVQLGDPETHILSKGGYICFAKTPTAGMVGVGALMRLEPGGYELSKMAVTQAHQGNGIGKAIALHCIEEAKRRQSHTLILYTNSCLNAAIHLYETLGFERVSLEHSPYKRGDTKMKLSFS